jgi:hypothetical protein
MVSLQYTITKDDYVSFYSFVFWEEGKKKRRFNYLKQAFFLVLFLSVIYFAGGLGSFNTISITIYALIFLSVVMPLVSGKTNVIKSAEKIADNVQNVSLFTDYNLVATDADLFIKTSYAETKYFWKSIIKKAETDTHYFLFENGIQAIIIPKRAFKNEEEKVALSKILSRNLSLDAEFNQTLT